MVARRASSVSMRVRSSAIPYSSRPAWGLGLVIARDGRRAARAARDALHLWAPDEVLPFLFIDSLQHAHLTAFITHPSRNVLTFPKKATYLGERQARGHAFCPSA